MSNSFLLELRKTYRFYVRTRINMSALYKIDARKTHPLYEPKSWRKMLVAAYASGTCLNVQNIIEFQNCLDLTGKSWNIKPNNFYLGCPFKITEIFSDEHTKRACFLEDKFNIRRTTIDKPPSEEDEKYLDNRWQYDRKMARILNRRSIDFFFFGGTGKSISKPFLLSYKERIIAVNMGDLSKRDGDRKFLYFGKKSILKSIVAGEKQTRISVFLLGNTIKENILLNLSRPMSFLLLNELEEYKFAKNKSQFRSRDLDEYALSFLQNRAKHSKLFQIVHHNVEALIKQRSHFILARTILDLSLGLYYKDSKGNIIHSRYCD